MIVGENGVVSVSGKKAGLNSSTACIFQDFYQYQTTVRENIEMGDPGRKLTDEEIWELLDTVGLREKVEGLEQGLDTRLGQLDGFLQGAVAEDRHRQAACQEGCGNLDPGRTHSLSGSAVGDRGVQYDLPFGGGQNCHIYFPPSGICQTDGQDPGVSERGDCRAGKP